MQVLEFDTPEDLLLKEESAFSRMVRSTGAANAQYLRVCTFSFYFFQKFQISHAEDLGPSLRSFNKMVHFLNKKNRGLNQ